MTESFPPGVPVDPMTFSTQPVEQPTTTSSRRFGTVDLTYPTLNKTLPPWYAKGVHSYSNVARRQANLAKIGYAPASGPDYTRDTVEKQNRYLLERRIDEGIVDPIAVTRRLKELSDRYPMMSPDMLLGYAMTPNAPVDPALASLDEEGVTQLLAQNLNPASGSVAGVGTGTRFDRKTTGIVTLPSGTNIEVGPGDIVIRDSQEQVVNVIPTVNPEEEDREGWLDRAAAPLKNLAKVFFYTLSMPYEGLVGAARNVGRTLSESSGVPLGDLALDILGYAPMVAAVREMLEGDEYVNPWEQTYMGQMILAAARGERIDVGTGWFINTESDIFARQFEAASEAYTINNQAFTLGRGLAGALDKDPNSLAYRNISGTVDFASAILLDPTIWAAGLGVPSRTARALTTPGSLLGVGDRGAAAVRSVRKIAGREPGTGRLEFGIAKRETAKRQARMLRIADDIPRQREQIARLRTQFEEAADDLDRRTALNEQIADAQRRVDELEAEGMALAQETEVLQLVDDIETAVEGRVAAQVEQERLGTINTVATPSARMRSNADQSREVEARLSIVERLIEGTSDLASVTGRGLPKVGSTVERNGKPWTVTSVGDEVVLTSERGARRKYKADAFVSEFGRQATDVPLHTRDQLRTALMDYVQKKSPEQRNYEVTSLEGLRNLPGDVTVTTPSLAGDLDMAVGALDSEDMVAAWIGSDAPQLLHAAETVPETVMERLWQRLTDEVLRKHQEQVTDIRKQARKGLLDDEEMADALAQAWVDSEALGDDLLALIAPKGGIPSLPAPEVRPKPREPQRVSLTAQAPGEAMFSDGSILTRVSKGGRWKGDRPQWEARDPDGVVLGTFPSRKEAAERVREVAARGVSGEGDTTAPPWRPETSSISPVEWPRPTWGDLLDGLNSRGMAPYLEKVIREDGFDGISGLLSRQPLDADGVWWGYNPNIASYKARVGRLAEDPDLRVRANYQVDSDGLALVLDDAQGMSAEVSALQGRIADLQNKRDALIASAADAGRAKNTAMSEVDSQIVALDEQIADALQKWAVAQVGLEASPNYTQAARRARIDDLRGRRRDISRERDLYRLTSTQQARVLSRTTGRLRNVTSQMSKHERILEGYRIAAGGSLDNAGRGAVDLDATSRFLFGGAVEGALARSGEMALRVMSQVTSPSQLHAMTKYKLADETVQKILAVTRQTVEDAQRLNPHAIENPAMLRLVDEGTMTRTQVLLHPDRLLTGTAAERALSAWKQQEVARILGAEIGTTLHRPLSKGNIAAQAPELMEGERPGPTTYLLSKRSNQRARRLLDAAPSAVKIDLHSPKDTAMGLARYLDMARVPVEEQWRILDELWDVSDGDVGQSVLSRNVLGQTFDMLRDRLVDDLDDLGMDEGSKNVLKGAIHSATRVWLAGERDAAIYWRDSLSEINTPIKVRLNDGTHMPITGAMLESELAHGALFLPDVEDFRKMVRRAAKWVGKPGRAADQLGPGGSSVVEGVERLFSDYWRSFMLLRVSYMVRNVLEMQIRNFLTGHINIFNNPMATLAMSIGPQVDPSSPMARRFALYSHDVNGLRFTSRKGLVDDHVQRDIIQREHADYLEMLRTDRSLNDVRMYTGKSARKRGAPTLVGKDSQQFNEAWAEELMLLRGSPIARILAGGVEDDIAELIKRAPQERERILARYVMHHQSAQPSRDLFSQAGPEYQRLLNDEEAMIDFLFGIAFDANGQRFPSNTSSVQARLEAMTGGNDRLMEFVRTGRVQDADGNPVRVGKTRIVSHEYLPDNYGESLDVLRETLTRWYKNSDDVLLPDSVRLWTTAREGMRFGPLDRGLDAFFKVATRFERVGVMGPEWRFVYWDTITDLAPSMTLDAQREMFDMFKRTGMKLRDQGRPIKRMRTAEKVLRDAKEVGSLTRDDVHRIASDRASEFVRDLYYDAHQRVQLWQAMRLAIPFGQAWYDSFSTWTRLAAGNPTQVYRAQRAFNAAMESGSNVIYEDADFVLPTSQSGWFESPEGTDEAPWYDPRQGFLYTDSFGERSFVIPGLGHALSGFGNALSSGANVPAGALQAQMRANNLNLLTGGGSPLPGLGPLISMPLSPILSRADVGVAGFFYDWLYPVGEPDLGNGIIDQFAPSWLRRLTSALFTRDSTFVMSNMGAASHYLTSEKGDYNLYDVADQDRLLDDSLDIAKWFAAVTAIGQFILPTVPSNVWVGETVDGNRVGLAAASALYYDGYRAMYDDDAEAQLAFLQDFGENFMFSFVGTTQDTRNGRVMSSESWDLVRRNPEIQSNTEEMAFLFPGGRAMDMNALAWTIETGRRERRTASEWSQQFLSYVLRTRRSKIEWDGMRMGLPDSEIDAMLAEVDDQIARAGGIPTQFERGGSLIEKTYAFIGERAPDEIVETENVQGFLQLYAARQQLQARAVDLGLKKDSLDAKSLAPYRTAYLNGLAAFEAQFPALRPIVRTFRNEVL